MVMKLSVLVFWLVILCGFAGAYQHFGGIYCPAIGAEEIQYHSHFFL
jgi:hypothetical protein